MTESAGDPHPHRRPSPPPPGIGKRRRRPNVRLGGSIPLPSHLPHPRRLPLKPHKPDNPPKPPQPHNAPNAPNPSKPLKPSSPLSASRSGRVLAPVDDNLTLAAAFPRMPRVRRAAEAELVADEEEEEEEEEEEVGSAIDVGEWLGAMGMGRYAAAFEAHEVDGEVLPCLTIDDLRDMGIGAVGARRKIFCAIQKLHSSWR